MVGMRLAWLASLWPWRTWRVVHLVTAADDVPQRLPRKAAVTVGDITHAKWLAFDCPCPERHRVLLNLDRRRYPSWTVKNASPLTLHPSVDETRAGQRCHYIISGGRVRWINRA